MFPALAIPFWKREVNQGCIIHISKAKKSCPDIHQIPCFNMQLSNSKRFTAILMILMTRKTRIKCFFIGRAREVFIFTRKWNRISGEIEERERASMANPLWKKKVPSIIYQIYILKCIYIYIWMLEFLAVKCWRFCRFRIRASYPTKRIRASWNAIFSTRRVACGKSLSHLFSFLFILEFIKKKKLNI